MTALPSPLLISVIIPTYNRSALLKESLISLTKQSLRQECFEVVVIDDGSSDNTRDVCRKFSTRLNLRYVRQANAGISAAKNLGIFVSQARILLFFDDDDVADRNLLKEHLATHRTHPDDTVAVLGYTTWAKSLQITSLMHYVTDVGGFLFSYSNLTHGQELNFTYFWGGRSSCKRSLLVRRGIFNQQFRFGSEDIELGYRLSRFGFKVIYNRNAISSMNRALTFDEFCRRCEKQGRSQHAFSMLHPEQVIQDYCMIPGVENKWLIVRPFLDQKVKETQELEVQYERTKPKNETLQKNLYDHYAWTFQAFKVKGIVAARRQSASANPATGKENIQTLFQSVSGGETGKTLSWKKSTVTRKKILIIAKELPLYDRSSGNFRLFQMMRILAAAGHAVTCVARPTFRNINEDAYIRELQAFGITVIKAENEALFIHGAAGQKSLAALLSTESFDLFYIVFYSVAEHYLGRLRELSPQTPVAIDSVDLHFLREQRKNILAPSEADRNRYNQTKRRELGMYRQADLVVVITEQDRQALLAEEPEIVTAIVPNIHPAVSRRIPGFDDRRDILFVGGFVHEPNVDAVEYFHANIWPGIAARIPHCRLIIAGNAPPARVLSFASDRVIVTGYVKDLEQLLDHARISIAPLRFGAGMKGKVGEAMAYGLPVVATPVAAEGMGLVHGATALIAETPAQFAESVVQLYGDKKMWERMSAEGKQFIEQHFSSDAVDSQLAKILAELPRPVVQKTRVQAQGSDTDADDGQVFSDGSQTTVGVTSRQPLSVGSKTFAIKCCSPSRESVGWGDTFFADALARAFEKRGNSCRVDCRDKWYSQPAADITIHIKGLYDYEVSSGSLNILWIISHPESVTEKLLKSYHIVYCASEPYAALLSRQYDLPVHFLPQAADTMFSDSAAHITQDFDLLFVGNNYEAKYGGCRKIIADLLKSGTAKKLAIVGQNWRGFVEENCILGDFVAYDKLPALYARAKIVLNDHNRDMQRAGFINNRTYDLARLKVFQITNHVAGIDALSIVSYVAAPELGTTIDFYLNNPEARGNAIEAAYNKTLWYTFENRADQFLSHIREYLGSGTIGANTGGEIRQVQTHEQRTRVDSPLQSSETAHLSICIPTYNRRDFVKDSIESILSQSIENFEIIIVDDGSTDGTESAVQKFLCGHIRYIRKEHTGAPATRNRCIAEAAGDALVWLDSDDVLLPGILRAYQKALETFKDVDVFYGDLIVADESLQDIRELSYHDWYHKTDELIAFLPEQNPVPNPGVMIRKHCYDRFGTYDESFIRAHDYEFWVRIAGRAVFKHIGHRVAKWRMHDSNWGGGKIPVDCSFEARVIEKLVQRYELRHLYPDINWNGFDPRQAKSLAYINIAKQCIRWGAHAAAIGFLNRSHVLFPDDRTKKLIQDISQQAAGTKAREKETRNAEVRIGPEEERILTITYLISSILGVTGGNQTLLGQANALVDRGHTVNIVTYSQRPAYFFIRANIIHVPADKRMADYVPKSDAVIATYFANALELPDIKAPVKIYFAQGDQFVFEDDTIQLPPDQERTKQEWRELSRRSYLLPGVTFVPNSHTLANAVEKAHGRRADALLPVCVDSAIFHPVVREQGDERIRILIVGPDTYGNDLEPLLFKGIADIKIALDTLTLKRNDFVIVRISNTAAEIFKDIPCEYHFAPDDPEKTDAFGTADILVYASHYDSCPRPPLEAMAAGAAVVCTETSGALEYCRNGVNCLTVPIQSPAAICDAIERLMTDRHLRETLVRGGFETANRYPQKREWDELEQLLLTRYRYADKPPEPVKGMTSIIIAVKDGEAVDDNCLLSIQKHTTIPYDLVVVIPPADTRLAGRIKSQLRKQTRATIVKGDSRANPLKYLNDGIAVSTGEFIAVVKPDTIVAEHWLDSMTGQLLNNSQIGIVGPVTNRADNHQQVAAYEHQSNARFDSFAGSFRARNLHRIISTRRIDGGCMLLRRSLYDTVGPFDDSLHSGVGQSAFDDYCLRAELEGMTHVIAGEVFVYHASRGSDVADPAADRTKRGEGRVRYHRKWNGDEMRQKYGQKLRLIDLREQFQQQILLGTIDRAVEILLEAIKLHPSEGGFLLDLAQLHCDVQQYERALDILEQSTSDYGSIRMLLIRTDCLVGLQRWGEAEDLLDYIQSLDPQNPLMANFRGVIAHAGGNLDEARQWLEKAISLDPSFGLAYTNLGAIYCNNGDDATGLAYLEKGIVLSPTNMDSLELYYSVAVAHDELTNAEAILRDAISLYPSARHLQFKLIDLLSRRQRYDEALAVVRTVMASGEIEDTFVDAALALYQQCPHGKTAPPKKWKTTLSLCMIVKNEQANIAPCLCSAMPHVDELVVVDTGSTDRTKDIAVLYGASVFEREWNNDFAEARNCSFDHASCDTILVLDADEIIAASDWELLRRQIDDKRNRPVAFTIETRNYVETSAMIGWTANDGIYPEEKGNGWFPSTKVRVFPGKAHIRMEGTVHEMVTASLERAGIPIVHCTLPVHHYGKLDAGKMMEKQLMYYELGKKKILENGEDLLSLKELAIQADELKKYDEAIALWKKVLAIDPTMAFAHYMMGSAYIGIGNLDGAKQSSLEALAFAPSMKDAQFNHSLCLSIEGKRDDARSSLRALRESDPDYLPTQALSAVLDLMEEKDGNKGEAFSRLQGSGFQIVPFISGFLHLLEQGGRSDDYEGLLAQCVRRGILLK